MSPWFKSESDGPAPGGSSAAAGSGRSRTDGDQGRNRKRRPESRALPDRGLAGPAFPERILRMLVGAIQFLLLLTLLVSAGAQSRYIFFKALYFRIQDITVKGNRALEPRDVVRLSGLDLGDLFFKYNYEKVKERIRANRRIEKVRIVVISPNSIEIQIQEKTPKFYLLDAEGQQLEVDRFGAVLGARAGAETLPLILGAVYAEDSPDDLQINSRQRDVLSRWVHTLEASPFANFTSMDITRSYGVVVHWENLELIVSDAEIFGQHLRLVELILQRAAAEGRHVSQIDMRFPNIFVRFRDIPIPDSDESTESSLMSPPPGAATGDPLSGGEVYR